MSWKATAHIKELTHAPNGEAITSSEKLVLLIIADYFNDEKQCAWASVPTIAKNAVLTDRRVRQIVHSAEKKGLLRITHRTGDSNVYELPTLDSLAESEIISPLKSASPTPEILSTPLKPASPPPLKPASGKPQLEPSCIEPSGIEPQKPRARAIPKTKDLIPLPEDFSLTDEMCEWATAQCKGKGLEIDVGLLTERFKNHALANNRKQVDWQAAWRNWILTAIENGWGIAKPKGVENATSEFSKGVGNGRTNAGQTSSAPGGYKAPKPKLATEQAELLAVSGLALGNGEKQPLETVPLSAPQDHAEGIGDSSTDVRRAEAISLASAPGFTPTSEPRRRFG
jgi:hypothetical protein